MEKYLHTFINEPYNPLNNFHLANQYFLLNQTAAAFSFFLRCADYTDNNILACECLLWCSKCLNYQKNRCEKEYDLILQAISMSPKTPHSYLVKCMYHSYRNQMMECYSTACMALEIVDDSHKFINNIGYTCIKDLYYQKAISGFNRGKLKESFLLLHKYFPNDTLLYKFSLEQKVTYLLDDYFKDVKSINNICFCSLSNREWMSKKTKPSLEKYTELYGCDLYYYTDTLDKSRHIAWSKLLLVNYLFTTKQYETIIWIDDDILLTDFTTNIRKFFSNEKDVVLSQDTYNSESFNTGFMIFKNNFFVKNLIMNVYNSGFSTDFLHKEPWEQMIFQNYYNENKIIQKHFSILPINSIQSQYTYLFHNIDTTTIKDKDIITLGNRIFWKPGDFSAHFITHFKDSMSITKEILGYPINVDAGAIDKELRLKSIENLTKMLKYFINEEEEIVTSEDISSSSSNLLLNLEKNNKLSKNIQFQIPDLWVIDNFYKKPDEIRKYALGLDYKNPEQHGAVGYRCESGRKVLYGTKEYFERIIGSKIKNHNNIGGWKYSTNGCFQWCPQNTPIVYHSDSQKYAAIIYLTPDAPPECGTSIFRHKIMKTSDSKIIFNRDWDISTTRYKDPYLNKHNWELVDKIGNIYNRLVIFKSHNVHAVSEYFGEDIYNSRLFQLFFFDIEEQPVVERNYLKLNNFPKTFILTIPENKKRKETLSEELSDYNIDYQFFECEKFPNCKSQYKTNLNEDLLKSHNLGVTFGHLRMIEYWYHNFSDDYAFFCEDDIHFSICNYWNYTWDDFMSKLGNEWSIVQTVTLSDNLQNISFSLVPKVTNQWGMTGYLLKRNYAKYIIDTHILSENYFDISLNYNDLLNTNPVLPEDLLYKQDELYNPKYFYPLSISIFNEKDSSNSIIHTNSSKYCEFYHKYKVKDINNDFIFIPNFDCVGNDIELIVFDNFQNIQKKLVDMKECIACNTLGYIKKSLDNLKINNLFLKNSKIQQLEYNLNEDLCDGIYIKKKYLQLINFENLID